MVKWAGGALLSAIKLNRSSRQTLGLQLHSALRDIILDGGLRAGERLPASRSLATDLGVSRGTVSDTYVRLVSEGLIESRVGAGSFVSNALKQARPRKTNPDQQPFESLRKKNAKLSNAISSASIQFHRRLPHTPRAFTTALPAFDMFPVTLWARLVAKHWRKHRNEVLGYGDPLGYAPLRQAIASHLKSYRGISCDPGQVFIVSGAQQAFHLIASVLLNPGDHVWFENPGAIGARNSLMAVGAKIMAIPVDQDGICVARGRRKAPAFRLAFVTPAHQQPLGATMSLKRRLALLQAAEDADAMIIEDDYDGEFCYAGRPTSTLRSMDRRQRVIYVGTFSKSIFPALRLGYFLAPEYLVDVFEKITSAFLQGVPTDLQAVMANFIDEGHFATHIRRMRKIYAERSKVLTEAAHKELAGRIDIVPTNTGLHTIGLLNSRFTEEDVSVAADLKGITLTPISRFCVAPIATKGLVFGFSGIPPESIIAGVDALTQVLEELDATVPTRR